MKIDCTISVGKTKALISGVFTTHLICVFIFAYAKSRFSHDTAHLSIKSGHNVDVRRMQTAIIGLLLNDQSDQGLHYLPRCISLNTKTGNLGELYEPCHEKTGFLHMQNQRRRAAARQLISFFVFAKSSTS